MTCTHELHEMTTAAYDGYCPLCMKARIAELEAEVERLRAELQESRRFEAASEADLKVEVQETARLRAALAAVKAP